ncbi:hypothetical protein OD350_28175 [Clostridium beijerinckii]|uniref:hypothetical protein n=1 Tax=Clostridium beijerinckii TaxID=1520 RepID=UPI0022280DF7|nr:hypothetical protein [Clostridium beijerinckii]UYZ36005.1 hypothetical protein OD350_28175 [Clostridium beijerinckii]
MNAYFKRFILSFCVLSIFTLSLRPHIAKANPIAIGAVEFVEGSLGGVVGGGAGYAGYDIIERYKKEASDFIIKKSLSTLTTSFFKFYSDSSGQKYVGIDGTGLDELKAELDSLVHSNGSISVSTTQTTSNTSHSSPFMLDGFYMKPYSFYSTSSNYVYDSFKINQGDTLNVCMYSSYAPNSIVKYSFTPTEDEWIRFSNKYSYLMQTSFDNSTFSNYSPSYLSLSSTCSIYIGYNTVSNTVYVPASQVITGNGIDGKASDSVGDGVVAVPISGQYDSTTGQKVWAPIDGANVGVMTGLTAIDSTKVGSNVGSGTDTQTGFWDSLWDWLKNIIDGIKAIPTLILNWFTIDWDRVKTHINYIDIVKQHFQPIYDIFDLISNVSADIKDSDGKFYMVIPHEMGGDDKEHCVLDLSVGAVYITTARDVIKYGMWMGFVWYVLRKFDPKFSI